MGQNGRLVAKYAGSSKLPKRISLIISGMNFGDMLDIAKWLRMRRKYPGRDLLLTARLPQRRRIAGNAAVVEHCLTIKPPWNTVRTGRQGNILPLPEMRENGSPLQCENPATRKD